MIIYFYIKNEILADYLVLQDSEHPPCFPDSQYFDFIITNAKDTISHEFGTQKSKNILRIFLETVQILS